MTLSTTTDANLEFALVENALYLESLILKGQLNRIELVIRPGLLRLVYK